MKSASQIADLLRRGEAETNLCSHLMRMPQCMYGIEITCQEPNPADKATIRGFWWREPLLNWEEDKTHVPSLVLGLDQCQAKEDGAELPGGPWISHFCPEPWVSLTPTCVCRGTGPPAPCASPLHAHLLCRGVFKGWLGGKTRWIFWPQQRSDRNCQ